MGLLHPYYLLNLGFVTGVFGPEAMLCFVWYHFGFVYTKTGFSCWFHPISLCLSKMWRERRFGISGAVGPDFEISNTIFEMCAKICQAATKREKITTIENV